MKNKRLIARLAGALIVMTFGAVSLAAQSTVGYVADFKGTWILNGSKTLSWGDSLPAAGSIRRQSSAGSDFITNADRRGKVIPSASRNCEGDCSRVITLPGKAPSNSMLDAVGAVFGTIAATVSEAPHRKRLHQIRSGELSEAVVTLTNSKIDLSTVLKTQGEQYLRWRVVSAKEARETEWTKPVKLDKTTLLSGFQAGLYEISLVRSNGGNFEPVAAAWILVTTAADYQTMQASFHEVQELIKQWGDNVRPETGRLFLQATLDTLARKAAK